MHGQIIRRLLDEKLTTLKEIEQVTGRGTSTLYRWMRGESEPHASDLRNLIRDIRDPRAKRFIVSLLTADLPIVVNWIEQEQSITQKLDAGKHHDQNDAVDTSIQAMRSVTDLIVAQRQSAQAGKQMTDQTYSELIRHIDDSISQLTLTRMLLDRVMHKRHRAPQLDHAVEVDTRQSHATG